MSVTCAGNDFGDRGEASSSLNSEFITTWRISSTAYTVQFQKSKHGKVSRHLFRTPNTFPCCMHGSSHLPRALVERCCLRTRGQASASRGRAGSAEEEARRARGREAPFRRVPPAGGRLSSGEALDVVLHLAAEVLLVPQVMLCSLDVQWVIKIQKISEQ